MRVSINLSDEMLQRVDLEAKRLGTSRGAMLTTWIGEKVNSLMMSRDMYQSLTNNMNEHLEQIVMDKLRSEDLSKVINSMAQAGLFDQQLSLLGKEKDEK